MDSVSFAMVSTFVYHDFTATFDVSEDDNPKMLPKLVVFVTVGIVFVVMLVGVLFGHSLDKRFVKVDSMSKNELHGLTIKKNRDLILEDNNHFIDSTLPPVFSSKSYISRIIHEIKRYHRWISFVFYYNDRNISRWFQLLTVETSLLLVLFALALSYNIIFPDDGRCSNYKDQQICEAVRERIIIHEPHCYWDRHRCHYVEPVSDIFRVFGIAIATAIIWSPFLLIIDWIVMNILASKTQPNDPIHTSSKILPDPHTSVTADSNRKNRRYSRAYDSREQLVSSTFNKNTVNQGVERISNNSVSPDLIDDIVRLNNDLREYRRNLSPKELVEFDGKFY
jgi:hypothetical protein